MINRTFGGTKGLFSCVLIFKRGRPILRIINHKITFKEFFHPINQWWKDDENSGEKNGKGFSNSARVIRLIFCILLLSTLSNCVLVINKQTLFIKRHKLILKANYMCLSSYIFSNQCQRNFDDSPMLNSLLFNNFINPAFQKISRSIYMHSLLCILMRFVLSLQIRSRAPPPCVTHN